MADAPSAASQQPDGADLTKGLSLFKSLIAHVKGCRESPTDHGGRVPFASLCELAHTMTEACAGSVRGTRLNDAVWKAALYVMKRLQVLAR